MYLYLLLINFNGSTLCNYFKYEFHLKMEDYAIEDNYPIPDLQVSIQGNRTEESSLSSEDFRWLPGKVLCQKLGNCKYKVLEATENLIHNPRTKTWKQFSTARGEERRRC